MKTIITLASLVLGIVASSAQWAVFDATNYAQVLQQLEEMRKSTGVLEKAQGALKKSNEYLNKINSAVKSFNYMGKIIQRNKTLLTESTKTTKLLKNARNLDRETIENFSSRIQSMLATADDNIQMAKMILKDGALKMNDFQRIEFLEKKLKEFDQKIFEMKDTRRSIATIIEARRLTERLNKL